MKILIVKKFCLDVIYISFVFNILVLCQILEQLAKIVHFMYV